MKSGVVIKAFPFAFDGINIEHLAVGRDVSMPEATFDGLVAAGYLEGTKAAIVPPDEALNRSIIEALDRRLAAASDQDLKDIIARSGTPYSGNLVHAQLVFAAKQQMFAEMNGASPVPGIDPNSGVTEQPLSAPGAPTPPSASAAIEKQLAQRDAAEKAAGENKATNQFGDPLLGGSSQSGEVKLDEMTVAELKEHAESKGINLGDATKKADILDAIKAAK